MQNACLRNVRLIFDRATRPETNRVVAEVVNYPGRWSSYRRITTINPKSTTIASRTPTVTATPNSATMSSKSALTTP